MTDPRLSNLAKTLVNYSVAVQPNDWVYIKYHTVAEPLLHEVYKEVLRASKTALITAFGNVAGEEGLEF